jgi:hypothetical protein
VKKRSGCLGVIVTGFAACLTAVAGLPIIAIGSGATGPSSSSAACGPGQIPIPTDGTPSILGPSTVTLHELRSWWDTTGKGQPSRLGAPIDDVIALYLNEGDAEGIRGDVAFAQAIHETGHFGSGDTARNNFAGIAHYDGTAAGQTFPDVTTGVRAHIQLLKKFAAGNEVEFAHPDVAPEAGHLVRSWGELAGTWATSTDYWSGISAIYDTMLDHAGREVLTTPPADPNTCDPAPTPGAVVPDGDLTDVRGIVVHTSIAAGLEALLAAAEADGLTLTGWGYRSYDRQVELRRAHCGDTHYLIYEAPASECSPPTARPGTSMHEVGLAVDFRNCETRSTRCWRWLNDNAATAVPDFALYNLPSEPWHWSVNGD